MTIQLGNASLEKPSKAHSELQRYTKKYLEHEAPLKYIVLTEVNLDQLRRNPNARRVDIWALRWMDPLEIIIGEIKVSRPDFLSDIRSGKWQEASESCHKFFFITTHGLITKDDLPKGSGWMEQKKNGKGFRVTDGILNEGFVPSDGLWASVVKKQATYRGHY